MIKRMVEFYIEDKDEEEGVLFLTSVEPVEPYSDKREDFMFYSKRCGEGGEISNHQIKIDVVEGKVRMPFAAYHKMMGTYLIPMSTDLEFTEILEE